MMGGAGRSIPARIACLMGLKEPKPIVELHTFLGILLMNSYNTDIFFNNYFNLQSVHFELFSRVLMDLLAIKITALK